MKFVIAAGGTGGHLFPGLAVGEVLKARGHEVMLIVSEKEIDTIATTGRSEFQVEKVPGVGLQGRSPIAIVKFLLKFYTGLRQCRKLIASYQPHAVLGMGGFTSLAPLMAGRARGAATYVHDSNAIPGKSNKLNARYCTAVLLGFEDCARFFPKSKCIVTGTPIRQNLTKPVDRAHALAEFGLSAERKTLFVMGGSQGAHGINVSLVKSLEALKSLPIQVVHLTGKADETMMKEAYAKAGIPAFVAAFWHQMELAYAVADLAIVRSGASSLTELSYFGIPSILIPYPYAAEDHQTLNAKIFERVGAAVLLPEREVTGDVIAAKLKGFFEEPGRVSDMSARCRSLATRDAAERVADVILAP